MSKSSLSTLKSEINRSIKIVNRAESDLKAVEKSIFQAMPDYVGASANDSVKGIYRSFSYMMDNGYSKLNNATSTLDSGYNEINSFLTDAQNLLKNAKSIKNELGDLQL